MDKSSQRMVDKTIADYNLIAHKFSSTRNKLSQDLIELCKIATVDDMILDYGCGNGRLCQLFDNKAYLGVDASDELINIARSSYPFYHFEIIKPSQMPKRHDFSLIYCLSVIHHLPDEESQLDLLKKFCDILNHKGKLVLTSWYIDSSDKIVEIPFKTESITITRNIYSFSLKNLLSITEQSGFRIIDAKIQPRNRGSYSNIEIIAEKIT